MSRGTLFDGLTADQHEADIRAENGELVIETGGDRTAISVGDLSIVDEDRRMLVLSRKGWAGWRLVLEQPVDESVRALLPKAGRYGGWIDRVGLGKATLALAGIAGAVLCVG